MDLDEFRKTKRNILKKVDSPSRIRLPSTVSSTPSRCLNKVDSPSPIRSPSTVSSTPSRWRNQICLTPRQQRVQQDSDDSDYSQYSTPTGHCRIPRPFSVAPPNDNKYENLPSTSRCVVVIYEGNAKWIWTSFERRREIY